MSKVSKTAKASMGMGVVKPKETVADDVLVQRYRDNREAHLWPPLEQSDALLRTLDAARAVNQALLKVGEEQSNALNTALADVEHLKRQLALANGIIASKTKALNDIATVAGIDPATLAVEPGLTGTQGQDSIGG